MRTNRNRSHNSPLPDRGPPFRSARIRGEGAGGEGRRATASPKRSFNSMPAQLRHSEGVTRVLVAARELAQAEGAASVTARHVLQALWRDESRAHEILSGA